MAKAKKIYVSYFHKKAAEKAAAVALRLGVPKRRVNALLKEWIQNWENLEEVDCEKMKWLERGAMVEEGMAHLTTDIEEPLPKRIATLEEVKAFLDQTGEELEPLERGWEEIIPIIDDEPDDDEPDD